MVREVFGFIGDGFGEGLASIRGDCDAGLGTIEVRG